VDGRVCTGFLILAVLLQPARVDAQSTRISRDEVGGIYLRARFALEFQRILDREGRTVLPSGLEHLEVPSDTLVDWILAQSAKTSVLPPVEPWTGEVNTWKVIPPNERLRYHTLFKDTKMAYVGNDYFTALDTTDTPQIRARMQRAFGAPTETIVESLLAAERDEFIQFQYWFLVNDSIPVIVMDAHGPFDRGIVLAGDQRFREYLYNVRQSLLGPTMRNEPYGIYVDYFYNRVTARWYRTGYDGEKFFIEHIRQPELAWGRPVLPEQ